MAVNARTIADDELFFGHKACAGCGGSLAVRAALEGARAERRGRSARPAA